MALHRFLTPSEFVKELAELRAFSQEYLGEHLLEQLDRLNLLSPIIRLRYPEPVALRFWVDWRKNWSSKPAPPLGELEPDGEVWEAAVRLENEIFRWQHNWHPDKEWCPHPLDNPARDAEPFLVRRESAPFVEWDQYRIDISSDFDRRLYDKNGTPYYSSWQVLVAAEAAHSGIFIRTNVGDKTRAQLAWEAISAGTVPENSFAISRFDVPRALSEFPRHTAAMDAVVWADQEHHRDLLRILKDTKGNRFAIPPAEAELIDESHRHRSKQGAAQYAVKQPQLSALGGFLADRWRDWTDEGRPSIAKAYRSFFAKAFNIMRDAFELTFDEARQEMGKLSHNQFAVDEMFPDWLAIEKERAIRTLQSSFKDTPSIGLNDDQLNEFVEFIANSGLESFFWRLNAFENFAFGGHSFANQAMRIEVQTMAVVLEHIALALGGTGDQLFKLFQNLWRDNSSVLPLLKDEKLLPLARSARLAADWDKLKSDLEAVRLRVGGEIAADLLWAHRIRGGVHTMLPETGHFELERQFVTLMRAAALTFVEVQRSRPNDIAQSKRPSRVIDVDE